MTQEPPALHTLVDAARDASVAEPAAACGLEVPSWIGRWFAANGRRQPRPAHSGKLARVVDSVSSVTEPWRRSEGGWWSRRVEKGELLLVSIRVPGAVHLPADAFEEACAEVYVRLFLELQPTGHRPVRLWNHIPSILEPLGGLEHRYMVFNAGRFRALSREGWAGPGLSIGDRVPTGNGAGQTPLGTVATASGVGSFGEDLVIHCLASTRPGEPIENPRQIPAYRYSERYGPRPPCFARATRYCEQGPWLLVGGTASVLGEDSAFPDDPEAQLEETLRNLAAVVTAGLDTASPGDSALSAYEHLRVYYPKSEHLPILRQGLVRRLGHRLGDSMELELRHAELCRPELLVEIEGLARLPGSQNST